MLSEPARLRLLALAAQEELGIGELAELLDESQPSVSRHAAALRHAGLLSDRREGTRTLVRHAAEASSEAVVADALASGKSLCEKDGSFARIGQVRGDVASRARRCEATSSAEVGASATTASTPRRRRTSDRREGTRTLVLVHAAEASSDAVVADALASGKSLCEKDGSFARIGQVLRAREAASREFFARPPKARVDTVPSEIGAYLLALAPLLARGGLALDAGTGDGRLLEVLAPVYERVVAVDRSDAQLARARERVASRGFSNVTFVRGELDGRELLRTLGFEGPGSSRGAGADAVFASRVLHHAPQPARVVAQLASLCAPGGALVVLDYTRHDDESMREQADAWLGFEAAELRRFARAAGLVDARVTGIPAAFCGDGPDKHLP